MKVTSLEEEDYDDNDEEKEEEERRPKVDENEIALQIRAVMRQITGSVTFLPTLEGDLTFKVLVYADHDVEVPPTWGDSAPALIKGGGELVRLRSFTTASHQIEPIINYRVDDSI
ncbi:Mitotic spindle checkpoint component mad2 [Apophysomyces ossiformis]|uniref:Mitotic spindle checkpoint component mad2 n=1 Tax=Apophysomyces ossiformis TaxID=679940 RepID=A0A8H7BTW2_9FUNG|nr:Mitotic spindle checkpoint component mad2 [Apophysomyces ossiformis]